jgi:hypothetical protein
MKPEIRNVLDVVITTSPALPDVVCRMPNDTQPSVGTAPFYLKMTDVIALYCWNDVHGMF